MKSTFVQKLFPIGLKRNVPGYTHIVFTWHIPLRSSKHNQSLHLKVCIRLPLCGWWRPFSHLIVPLEGKQRQIQGKDLITCPEAHKDAAVHLASSPQPLRVHCSKGTDGQVWHYEAPAVYNLPINKNSWTSRTWQWEVCKIWLLSAWKNLVDDIRQTPRKH